MKNYWLQYKLDWNRNEIIDSIGMEVAYHNGHKQCSFVSVPLLFFVPLKDTIFDHACDCCKHIVNSYMRYYKMSYSFDYISY